MPALQPLRLLDDIRVHHLNRQSPAGFLMRGRVAAALCRRVARRDTQAAQAAGMYCIVRYQALVTHPVGDTPVVAVCKEVRHADEWGDPGALHSRELIGIEGPDNQGPGLFRQLTSDDPRTQGRRGLRLVRRITPFEWAG